MHLIEMELYGFKSFAKRTRIRFSEDITAIVGPNGSGKSNIVDGIMWALGESSVKQLRGNKMEDVIFSGTDQHQGVNFAEVVLTFDNKDGFFDLPYEELSVSRKYFRSGESQYMINKKRVRQKDVREIFLDTGIGKNGYSFIGQGQIEEVLSTRPQDRRNAFEEAAGISRFKLRKEETLRNLNQTAEHVKRIDDIFSELKSRSSEMEEKREKALRLGELEAAKEKYHFALLTRELEKAKEKQEKLLGRYDQFEKTWKKEKDANGLLEESLQRKENDIDADENREATLNEQILILIREKEQALGELRLKTERRDRVHEEIKGMEASVEDLKNELQDLERHAQKQQREVEARKREADEKSTAVDYMSSDYAAFREKVEVIHSGEKSRRASLDRLADRRHSLESRLQALDYLSKERRERLEQLAKRKEDLTREVEDISRHVEDHERRKEDRAHELSALTDALKRLQATIRDKKAQKETSEEEIRALSIRIEGIEREKRYLERLRENHEGFQYGVKQFLKAAQSESFYDTVIGAVAEHLHAAKDDALAISTALGYGGQNIILKDDHTIQTILSYLKRHKMGRLTFLPLNNLSYRPLSKDLKEKTAVSFRVASDCVSYSRALRPVADFLLGRILLVDTVDEARQLANDLKHRFRIVTRGGDVFQVGGAVTGGQTKNSSAELYTRDSEISAKALELGEAREQLSRKKEIFESVDRVYGDLLEEEKRITLDFEEKEEKQRKLADQLYRLRSALESGESQLASLVKEIQKETEAAVRDKKDREEQKNALEELALSEKQLTSEEHHDVEMLHEDLEQRREDLNAAKLDKQKRISAYRESALRLEQISRDVQGIKSRLETSMQNLKSMAEEKEKLDEVIQSSEPEQRAMDQKVSSLQEDLTALRMHLSRKKQALREEKSTLEEKKEQAFTLEKKMLGLQTQLEEADRACLRFADALSQMENPGEIRELFDEPVATLRKQEAAIDKEIILIGSVDGDALRQYDAWKERVDFLSEQREDLLISKQKLEEMIKHLDKDMRKQLEEALVLINGYFNDIFRELFQGGKASLAWDEGDILEAGILISAQPPGKKLQSLSLLSGGERSMTAVALLFALLRMRQSPFCIVDEIDAALDDANIRRYSNYVKKIEDMQFIMITHRKQTMEMANEIYGVTMEEKGISRLLFLELEEVESHVGVAQTKNR